MKRAINVVNIITFSFLLVTLIGCKKTTDDPEIHETGTLTDVDHNLYKTVKIGNQWWMAEDLKVESYSDGTPINKIRLESQSTFDSIEWVNDTIGAFCNIFDNGLNIVGKLYNHFAITNLNKIAPVGWHIPSDDDWKELETHLGMSQSEADKNGWRGTHEGEMLKIKGPPPTGWQPYNEIWATNTSEFSGKAMGCRLFNTKTGDPGQYYTTFWWTSTTSGNSEAYYRYLDYKNANVFRSHCLKTYGFSIRCIKDRSN